MPCTVTGTAGSNPALSAPEAGPLDTSPCKTVTCPSSSPTRRPLLVHLRCTPDGPEERPQGPPRACPISTIPRRPDLRGVAGEELVTKLDRPDPAGDRPPASGWDRSEEQVGEPGSGPPVECGGEVGGSLTRSRHQVRDVIGAEPVPPLEKIAPPLIAVAEVCTMVLGKRGERAAGYPAWEIRRPRGVVKAERPARLTAQRDAREAGVCRL